MIEVRGVEKTYRQGEVDVHALRGVDMEVDDGEFSVLAGPSGSGKTTLLNMIGGLDHPTEGHVDIDGTRITDMSRSEAADYRLEHVGFVFQAYNLVPVLTAYENAEFVLMMQGVPKRKRREIVVPMLEEVGLEGMLDRKPTELSGGQQQRVAIVRALASTPNVVLADEPTANLDAETSGELLDLMLELNREYETTFLFSTHDELVMERARRIVRLRSGRIESDRWQS
jgi:putative ABC transport system ATP-binding protein